MIYTLFASLKDLVKIMYHFHFFLFAVRCLPVTSRVCHSASGRHSPHVYFAACKWQ